MYIETKFGEFSDSILSEGDKRAGKNLVLGKKSENFLQCFSGNQFTGLFASRETIHFFLVLKYCRSQFLHLSDCVFESHEASVDHPYHSYTGSMHMDKITSLMSESNFWPDYPHLLDVQVESCTVTTHLNQATNS